MVQITGGAFQDAEGNALANGRLLLRLSAEQSGNAVAVDRSTVKVLLDGSGNVAGTVSVWPNDVLSDTTSFYWVTAYSASGQRVWGPSKQQILSSPSPFNLSAWTP